MVQTSISNGNSHLKFNPLLDKVLNDKTAISNNAYYYTSETIQPLVKSLPKYNYIKCFCPIHGDQPDNDKHKCSLNDKEYHCISSLRYNCAHCNSENGRGLSHIAFQKHLRKYHINVLNTIDTKGYSKRKTSYTPVMISITGKSNNSTFNKSNTREIETSPNMTSSYLPSNRNILGVSNRENPISCHKIKINSVSLNKNKNISVNSSSRSNNSNYSYSFISLQLICACELLIEKTLEDVFHESYLSYDIPTKLMVLKYAITDNKIECESSFKKKIVNCIETLENYFNINNKMGLFDLERELRLFLQFLLNYTKKC
ncbi:hypothetical protein BCR32DRAFT_271727 [Anaeromyces robustus]|uniref:Uncharacterized protein n=1 Tax=Anaeromyces robustus TaxID=1754192 RepID=A0A1Y1WRH4_9FUNG|nr:hypothetical protein BCR32DRAFT_271727 [Anaeromyces robustus]|eukprot:ORX75724.1 hypothetical protein BCR32DRAFT_271727 [Anaeromyces robustus]